MYSSKFWLSVSFQVAQKASTILGFPRLLQKQMKAADAGISGSRGHCNSKDPLHLTAAPAFLFREEAGGEPRIWVASTSLRRPSFPEAVEGARAGKGGRREARGAPVPFVIGSATGLAEQVVSLPVLEAQPFCCLRNLCEASMRSEAGSGKWERVFQIQLENLAKAVSGCEERKKKCTIGHSDWFPFMAKLVTNEDPPPQLQKTTEMPNFSNKGSWIVSFIFLSYF